MEVRLASWSNISRGTVDSWYSGWLMVQLTEVEQRKQTTARWPPGLCRSPDSEAATNL